MNRGVQERESGVYGGRGERDLHASIRVRPCRAGDRVALRRLGHPPGVPELFLPSFARSLGSRLARAFACGLVAEDPEAGEVVGSVHFVRCRREPATWMFQHWRVASWRRGLGIGGLLLREGVRLIPGIGRLYSYVDWGNEASMKAHQRLGFEASPAILGRAGLGALSTIGPTSPAGLLVPVRGPDQAALFPLYARAMGGLWLQLLPGPGSRRHLPEYDAASPHPSGLEYLPWRRRARTWSVRVDGATLALIIRRGASVTLFTDPESCDAGLLARAANAILTLGVRRDREIELRGLPRALAARRGPIAARVLMGMPDVGALARRPVRADS